MYLDYFSKKRQIDYFKINNNLYKKKNTFALRNSITHTLASLHFNIKTLDEYFLKTTKI